MPELPEVESIRREIAPRIEGAVLSNVKIRRRDVLRDSRGRRRGSIPEEHLGVGARIHRVGRRGKQLTLEFSSGVAAVVRLGMSGRVDVVENARPIPRHQHVLWTFETPAGPPVQLGFVDPRRFGGVHLAADRSDLERRLFGRLGPEATTIGVRELVPRLRRTSRALKSAVLDQAVLAGVGNIYADESLHRALLSPERPANELERHEVDRLCRAIRTVLRRAIDAGGSTLRDHRLPDGRPGEFTASHQVYGRAGLDCPRCGDVLVGVVLGGRGTTFCPSCQSPHPIHNGPTPPRGGARTSSS